MKSKKISAAVQQVYDFIDSQTAPPENSCTACGKCCDFENFDHKLFVTSPELIYFANKNATEKIKPMQNETCPYKENEKCTVYENRFAGCRIFSCKADKDFQSTLTEKALSKLKSICKDFQIPYRCLDLETALNIPPEEFDLNCP